ncbi:carbohydrate ABC transporter permease [Hespellia stercorisuis]|uniref:Carbohydrate ABC transporter membrane protein 1, CUT1 family (TC 3.A.1.1.-) n=1 Tax=Hespellia stercorisuis DSM 15480 TaxID=1121950 RepID=A0A1M6K9B2_9FIRM|nr:sugar ABC transporter permease [Hespellia stercorisuis]SHJ55512.1 carbohydrate ABC transporter membrane protein 1, CUT1 family (TC 3.A.1.1.-) [Hespellia stercorisuis DSM 15480]
MPSFKESEVGNVAKVKNVQPKIRKSRGDVFASWMFLVPTMIFLGITALLPLLYSLYLSFFDLKLNLPNAVPQFVGLGNYIKMFTDASLGISTWNTFLFAVVSVALEVVVGLVLAMALCSDKMWARIATSIFLIPMIMAPVAVGTLWRMMLDSTTGIINYFLSFVGVPSITWLSSTHTAMLAVILVNVWQLVPWVTIICAAGLKALPADCLEAACVDGATNGQIFRKIVLPMMSPILTVVIMLRFVDAFKVFDTVYVMTNGGPGTATEMLPNYIYKQGLRFFNAGYSASLAIVFVVVMTVITFGFLKLRDRLEAEV